MKCSLLSVCVSQTETVLSYCWQVGHQPIGKEKFVNRINQTLFTVYHERFNYESYTSIFKEICYKLGLNPNSFYDDPVYYFSRGEIKLHLKEITENDFQKTLRVIIALDEVFEEMHNGRNGAVDEYVDKALRLANVDLGIRW